MKNYQNFEQKKQHKQSNNLSLVVKWFVYFMEIFTPAQQDKQDRQLRHWAQVYLEGFNPANNIYYYKYYFTTVGYLC